jgi:D-alanine-D-alanine ligase
LIDEQVLKTLSLPVVVKPNREGSSVGVTIVQTRDQLSDAVREAKHFGGSYLVETYIPGKEITATIIDYCEVPLIEIRPKGGFFDYHNKYQPGSCDYLVPAPLEKGTTDAVVAASLASYRALGCRGYARIDFRLTDGGDHFFLEANTLPGLTSNSLVPKAAREAGIEYADLVDMILRLSMDDDAV